MIECPRCHGDGGWYTRFGPDDNWDSETCDLCGGTGDIPAITIWESWDSDKKEWRHNHIEDGFCANDHPTPKFPSQEAWKRQQWRKSWGILVEGKVERSPVIMP